jgi:uncharacterized protein (DUF3084 family)
MTAANRLRDVLAAMTEERNKLAAEVKRLSAENYRLKHAVSTANSRAARLGKYAVMLAQKLGVPAPEHGKLPDGVDAPDG